MGEEIGKEGTRGKEGMGKEGGGRVRGEMKGEIEEARGGKVINSGLFSNFFYLVFFILNFFLSSNILSFSRFSICPPSSIPNFCPFPPSSAANSVRREKSDGLWCDGGGGKRGERSGGKEGEGGRGGEK